ncbi:MAG: hypothetical protein EP344_00565 [Bacteroidetes bacterium]|nr:MAG: hypothetical protein EP344_00565 [Bacteroidota bacterium]
MKKNTILLSAALGALLLGSCEEKPITIPELSVGKRQVLAEELTGVRCPNCPDGTAALVGLDNQYGENLIIVSIHAAPGYDQPYPESKYDFRTTKGGELASFVGDPSFFPTAAINRRIVPPETEPYLPRSIWAGIIAEELAKDPIIGVFLETGFDPVTRKLNVSVNLAPENTISDEVRLTVLITQDSIQDYQKVNLDKVPDYYHRHVLRDVLSQATGDVINEALNPSSVITREYTMIVPDDWKEEHLSVIAFAHYGTNPNKEVLQAAEEHVIK